MTKSHFPAWAAPTVCVAAALMVVTSCAFKPDAAPDSRAVTDSKAATATHPEEALGSAPMRTSALKTVKTLGL